MVSVKTALVSALCLLDATNAAPAPKPIIDYLSLIEPGPGMPHPRDLGMTKEDLAKPIPRDILARIGTSERRDNVLQKRYTCLSSNRCNIDDSVGCFNYLLGLGTTECRVSGPDNTRMCKIGKCGWFGVSPKGSAASYCRDVAYGGATVNDNCNAGGQVAGINYAGGNGDFQINIGVFD